MSNARNLAKVAVDANGDIGTASLDNLTGALGYTPVNKAGDTMTGALVLDTAYQNGLRILRDYDVTVSPAGQAIQFGAKLGGTPVYPVELIGATDTDGSAYRFEVKMDSTYPFTIDSAGRVTMPYQPAFAVYKSGSQATSTPAAQLTGWIESFNTGGHFSTATSRFTAPVSGKYLINYTGLHHSGGVNTGYWVRVYLTVNGATVVDGLGDNGTYGNYQRLSLSQVLSLNAGDYVTLLVETSVASSTGVYAGYTHWSGFLVG